VRLRSFWPFGRTRQVVNPDATFSRLRLHVEDMTKGEQAGFLLCGVAQVDDRAVLLAREWMPIPETAVVARDGEFGLEWTAEFSAEVLHRGAITGMAVVLIHSHGNIAEPQFSGPDRRCAQRLFPGFSRVLSPRPCGSVVFGRGSAAGHFWIDGHPSGNLEQVRIVGAPIQFLMPDRSKPDAPPAKRRHDRMIQAIGPEAEAKLAAANVAVIGLCGGGSHVCQQLAHMGIGRIVPIDGDLVEDVNLGRMVGATPADVNATLKTEVMKRLIASIDPDITIETVPMDFPDPAAVAVLKSVDVVVSCVDSFLVREQINSFCRRYHLPLVDIGLVIKTSCERLASAFGQVTCVVPDSSCLRCGPLLSDEVLAREREELPPGYDKSLDAPGAPQVVSMNGTLASEACNTVLDLITGYAAGARGAGWWLYNGKRGSLERCEPVALRANCPACSEKGHGDPQNLSV
jgi:molybdopterin-synthase adenylyltransferase